MPTFKFGRNYFLEVQTRVGTVLEIAPPFTVEFDITRNVLTSANVCQIRIFNLAQNNRNQIRFDINDVGQFRSVQLQAGYGLTANLPIVFAGNISQAWSVREGNNFITTIECYDGGFAFANGQTNTTFPTNTAMGTVLKTLAGSLPQVALGAIGNYPGALSRGVALSGNTANLLRDLTGGGFFIDNGKANCLNNSEVLEGQMQIINSQSGLLGTPILEQTIVTFDMIFEPRLVVGQQIQLDSSTGQNFNGFYKITALKHRGMISPAVCGDAITSVSMWYGTSALTTVPVQ